MKHTSLVTAGIMPLKCKHKRQIRVVGEIRFVRFPDIDRPGCSVLLIVYPNGSAGVARDGQPATFYPASDTRSVNAAIRLYGKLTGIGLPPVSGPRLAPKRTRESLRSPKTTEAFQCDPSK